MQEIYVANTDNVWFDFLKARQPLEEVNFWKPSQQIFRAIGEGGLFVFRLKSPRNVIGGYGILASATNVPMKFAWDSFGEANGAPSLDVMVSAIARYRRNRATDAHSLIGCRILVEPVFFEEHEWFEVPSDWSANIVTGKVYSPHSREGERMLEKLMERARPSVILRRQADELFGFQEPPQPALEGTPEQRRGAPVLVTPRLGQGGFRVKVAESYSYTCGVSKTRVLPALDAAHIKAYAAGGLHRIDNGLFLRKDIHSVFDEGFATFDNDFRFVVSSQVKERFNNGSEYRRLHGTKLALPAEARHHPSLANLEWHQNNRFVGA